MRKNDYSRMTVVEQVIAIREEICDYSCKYKEEIEIQCKDPLVVKVYLQRYCKDCPVSRLHFTDDNKE